jgi:hypothetical protein
MRGKGFHRWLGLGVLGLALAFASVPAAQAVAPPGQAKLTGVHAALEHNRQTSEPVPDVFERAVLRTQGYTPAALQALEQRWQAIGEASQGAAPQDAFERAVLRSPDTGQGYTPAALQALGQRGQALADAWAAQTPQGPLSTTADSHGRAEMPVSTTIPTLASGDGDGIAWVDLGIGSALGFALAAIGALGAMAVRGHGRVTPS